MARTFVAVLIGAALLAGCQQVPVVDRLPPLPNLDGPRIVPPDPQPVAAAPRTAPFPKPPTQARPNAPQVPPDWVPQVQANAWRWIVIHHSATPSGSAAQFDQSHRQKGWDELGYHFVIGNGAGSADGQVEVGPRWARQKWGAHTKTPDNQFNDFGIGICLVGDLDVTQPTAGQLRSLTTLVAYLMATYHIPPDRVIGHGDAKPTHCPGRNLNVADVRFRATLLSRDAYAGIAEPTRTASRDVTNAGTTR